MPSANSLGQWLIGLYGALLLTLAVIQIIGFFRRKPPIEAEFATKAELADMRNEIANVRRQTEALVREIMSKLEDVKTEILVTDERRICGVHDRLNEVEAAVARVDERTRLMRGERP